MARKIIIMPEEMTEKIAAGEVVERPASIVKELLENAVDADATDITVEIEKGGKHAIRITDNGTGIERDDATLVFHRHATSKIYSIGDIFHIHSLGFRGEALNSIAAISSVEMCTRTVETMTGTRIAVGRDGVPEILDIGCPVGTTVRVSNIFERTPARLKFLKSNATEQRYCIDAILQIAIAYPDIKFTVIVDKKSYLTIPVTSRVNERIALAIGQTHERDTIAISNRDASLSVYGYVSKPQITRSNTREMMFYVNRRHVRDPMLHQAVMSSYRRIIEARRYPTAIIFLELPAEDVDVNVHPAKKEIRFMKPRDIFDFVSQTVESALKGSRTDSWSPTAFPDSSGTIDYLSAKYQGNVEEALSQYSIRKDESDYAKYDVKNVHRREQMYEERMTHGLFQGEDVKGRFSQLQYLGVVSDTYLVCKDADAVVIIDQHAAHERILFEKIRAQLKESRIESQRLLIPEVVDLNPSIQELFFDHMNILIDCGFEVERYGEHTALIKSVPAIISRVPIAPLVSDLIDEFSSFGKLMTYDEVRDKITALLACKAAVKAGHQLSKTECEELFRDLDTVSFSANCPHGRPVYVRISIHDMEKMFKR